MVAPGRNTPTRRKPKRVRAIEEYRPALLRYLGGRLGNPSEADDLAQEAFLRLIRVKDQDLIRQPEAYLFKIAANLASEHLLKRKTTAKTIDLDEWAEKGGDGDDELEVRRIEARSAIKRVETILAGMPPLYKSVLLLAKREGLSHREIAERLNISVQTVPTYLKRAFERCRAEWTE